LYAWELRLLFACDQIEIRSIMSMLDARGDDVTADQTTILGAPRPRMRDSVSVAREIARIGKTITIVGDVIGEESLVIDGKVDGTILLKNNDLTVGQSGQVTASIRAHVVRVEGEVTGDITGDEKVVITKTGRVFGNVVAPRVTLEDGARFKGRIDMDPGPAQQAGTPTARKSVPASRPRRVPGQPNDAVGKA
jgi:cytoskeletal protein CcmA (bactofilin family)